jgi:hypothetical protein
MTVRPALHSNGTLYDYTNSGQSDTPLTSVPNVFTDTFLHHHATREIQTVSLDFVYQKEVQVSNDNYSACYSYRISTLPTA